jgi:quercetin dioxygenase-like cupin family protein
MDAPVRRIVTGHDRHGNAAVLFDSVDAHKRIRPETGIVSRTMWTSDRCPAAISLQEDPVADSGGIAPPDNGTVLHVVDFPPFLTADELPQDYMQRHVGSGQSSEPKHHPHPMVHRTRTLDYAIILAGEIDMLLDETSVHCKAGDVIIQQGTLHGWVNNGSQPCRIAFVMIDAEPLPAASGQ